MQLSNDKNLKIEVKNSDEILFLKMIPDKSNLNVIKITFFSYFQGNLESLHIN